MVRAATSVHSQLQLFIFHLRGECPFLQVVRWSECELFLMYSLKIVLCALRNPEALKSKEEWVKGCLILHCNWYYTHTGVEDAFLQFVSKIPSIIFNSVKKSGADVRSNLLWDILTLLDIFFTWENQPHPNFSSSMTGTSLWSNSLPSFCAKNDICFNYFIYPMYGWNQKHIIFRGIIVINTTK